MKNFQLKAAFAAFLISISASFTACNNDDDVVPAAEITVTAPEEGGIVNAGQSVAITGTIAGNTEIHGYVLFVRQKSDNKVLFTKAIDAHEKDFTINETWAVDTVAKYKELELEVLATLDHDGKTQSKKLTLYALPAGQENHAIITITSPVSNAIVLKNTNLNITGSINAIATVHGFTYKIHPQGDTATLFKKTVHIHEKNITITESWPVPAVIAQTNYELEVIANLDHAGNTEIKKVNFSAKP
jgi:hypothetical protein